MENRKIISSFLNGFVLVAVLWLFRSWFTHTLYYGFLLWNMFLAFIPYYISQYLTDIHSVQISNNDKTRMLQQVKWWLGFAAWLLFFPNAPYIITDFIHLSERHGIPKWYDAALLFCAASTGLWIGCLSLMQMERLWRLKVPAVNSAVFVAVTFLLCGFGIYLGRMLRFNSWDIVANPLDLAETVGSRLLMPWQHRRTWCMTFLFAAVLWIGYRQVKQTETFKMS